MACMEHVCIKCSYTAFNNQRSMICPKCRSRMISYFDESKGEKYDRNEHYKYEQEDDEDTH